MVCLFFFFFKQKTAYEMRISDWSSDVCSSDLDLVAHRGLGLRRRADEDDAGGVQRLDELRVLREEAEAGVHRFGAALLRRRDDPVDQIGRASCRERVCQYV